MCGVCRWPLPSFPQASGDRSKLILIWEAQSCQHLYTFTGHRDAVSVRLGIVTICLAWAPAECAHLVPGARPQTQGSSAEVSLGSEWCVKAVSVLKRWGGMEGDQVQLEPGRA